MLKKILAIACTIFMLCGMTAFALEADTALAPEVRNGDFSAEITGSYVPGWNASQGASLAVPAEGDYAGALEVSYGGEKAYSTAEQSVIFDYAVGKKYTLEAKYANPYGVSGKIMAANGSTAGLIEASSQCVIPATVQTDWVPVEITFVTPEKADEPGVSALSKVLIWLANYGKDTEKPIYFDDVKLYETPMFINGDFENGGPTSGYTDVSSKISIVTNDDTNAHSGSAYLKVSKAGGGRFTFPVNCTANTAYKLTYWFKWNNADGATASGFPRVGVGASIWDNSEILDEFTGKNFVNTINGLAADTWVKRTHYFKTPADTTQIYIKIFGTGGYTQVGYYDDIKLELDENKVELHNSGGVNGSDITEISTLPENAPLYAKARFLPETATASAMLVAVVFDESKGTKQLEYIDVKPYSTTTGAATTLELTISGYESFAGKAVEVYLWDSADGLKALTKKLRRSQNAAA